MRRAVGLACVACAMPALASAHSLATPYILPVPFWMYLYGCAATLIVTFAVLGYFWGGAAQAGPAATWEMLPGRVVTAAARGGLQVLRLMAVAWLLLMIVAGLFGTADPKQNINMMLFWIVFLLGFTYLTVLVGDLYSLISPWKVIVQGVKRLGVNLTRPRVRYPSFLAYWPAFVLYIGLIWYELFALPKPFVLSVVLLGYTALTLIGVFLFGHEVWFQKCDVFSVFFRTVATLAPVEYSSEADGRSLRVRFRPPFVEGMNSRPEHISLVLFILFMLSSTTYDAIHQTVLWAELYWRPLVGMLESYWGMDSARIQGLLSGGYVVYQRGGLVVSSLLYLGIYLCVLWWARRASRAPVTLRALALSFAYSLVPIAVAYHLTHYYPMLLMEAKDLPWLSTDPLGLGWNLWGLIPPGEPEPLPMGVVWHTQVALLLVGHVISVYQSHIVAMKTFSTRRQVVMSQLPLLVLMVAYTATGLWILSLPLAP